VEQRPFDLRLFCGRLAAYNVGSHPSVNHARQLTIPGDPKYFLQLSIRYFIIADSRRSCRLSRLHTFFLARAIKLRDGCGSTALLSAFLFYYRAMHYSAKRGLASTCRLSVRPSVRPSVYNVGL